MRCALTVALLLAACGRVAPSPPAAPQLPEVTLVRPARQHLARTTRLPCELWAWQQVEVLARVNGYVSAVLVDRGARVRAGDTLARVAVPELEAARARRAAEVEVAQAEVARARAESELDRLTYERTAALLPGRAATPQEVDVARASLEAADAVIADAVARLEAARRALTESEAWLDYATVRAPFDGGVTERLAAEGTLTSDGAVLFRLVDDGTLRAVVDVPEADAPRVGVGTPVSVTIPELAATLSSFVARTAQSLDLRARTLRVEADLPNPQRRLLPGTFCHATLTLEIRTAALAVPRAAVSGTFDPAVFVVDGERVRRVPVQLGLDAGHLVEVTRGLRDTDVVASPARGLADGARILVRGAP